MGSVVIATPRPLYQFERPVIHCVGSWMGPSTSLNGRGVDFESTSSLLTSPQHSRNNLLGLMLLAVKAIGCVVTIACNLSIRPQLRITL